MRKIIVSLVLLLGLAVTSGAQGSSLTKKVVQEALEKPPVGGNVIVPKRSVNSRTKSGAAAHKITAIERQVTNSVNSKTVNTVVQETGATRKNGRTQASAVSAQAKKNANGQVEDIRALQKQVLQIGQVVAKENIQFLFFFFCNNLPNLQYLLL